MGNAMIPVFEISIRDPRIRGYTLLTFFSSNQIEVVLCVLNLFHASCTLDKATIQLLTRNLPKEILDMKYCVKYLVANRKNELFCIVTI